MDHGWFGILDSLLRPARPGLERCLRERARQLGERRSTSDVRARAIADCVGRIDAARAVVLRADDGIVGANMTELEREWLLLSRVDPEAGLMEFWASVAPASWIDRKRFRGADLESRFDAAVLLAADAENVEAAERAIDALRSALARQGTRLGARIRWRFLESGGGFVPALLARTLEVAREACPVRERAAIVEHARRVDAGVENAARGRIPDWPGLAADLGRSAGVDVVFGASSLPRAQNPALALRALYATGYLLGEWDEAEVTLELPPLEPRVTPPA